MDATAEVRRRPTVRQPGSPFTVSASAFAAFAEIAIGKMPRDEDDVGARSAGREASLKQNGATVAAGSIDAV